jgi:hypothetical protein
MRGRGIVHGGGYMCSPWRKSVARVKDEAIRGLTRGWGEDRRWLLTGDGADHRNPDSDSNLLHDTTSQIRS